MLTTIIVFILATIVAYYLLNKDNPEDGIEELIVPSIFIGFVFGFIMFITSILLIPAHFTLKEVSRNTLENISDGSNIKGSFHIGSGYIGNEMHYSFYIKEKYGFSLCTVSAEDTHIKYTKKQPYIITYKYFKNDDWINYFSLEFNHSERYTIYVPYGSIIENYTLDAK